MQDLQIGDVIQLSFDGHVFTHSMLVVELGSPATPQNILIATHTIDSDYRPLSTYTALKFRYLHIDAR